VSNLERDLLSLPGRFGGLCLDNPFDTADMNHANSTRLSSSLVGQIVTQDSVFKYDVQQQTKIKIDIKKSKDNRHKQKVSELAINLPQHQQRALLAAQEKGASCLVTTLPLQRYGFSLNKQEFRDHLLMRYHWTLPDLPALCACGSPFDVDHSQICHLGGFINMRHNEIRDLLASEMRECYNDVEIEPCLIPLTGEIIHLRSAIRRDDARSDIRARGFWQRQQNAHFDIRVFYPHASSYLTRTLSSLYTTIEKEKKRQYNDRIVSVEQGTFTPLVFSSTGGMGPETTVAIKHLAVELSNSRNEPYSKTMSVLRCRLAFSLMRAASVCLRGTRLCRKHIFSHDSPADLIIQEASIDQ